MCVYIYIDEEREVASAEANRQLVQQVSENQEKSNKKLFADVSDVVTTSVGRLDRKIDAVATDTNNLRDELKAFKVETAQQIGTLRAAHDETRAALRLAQAAEVTQKDIQESDFARVEDPTILKINAAHPTTLEFLRPVVAEWLHEAGFSESVWQLKGPARGIKFKIQFSGTGFSALSKF